MTVVPDDDWLRLICDGCGDSVAGPAPVLPDAEVVWTFVADHGWGGSAFATGPHRCPRCVRTPPTGASDGSGTPERAGGTRALPDVERLGGVLVVTVAGDIGADTGGELQAALATTTATGRPVLLDLGHARQIDPAGLGLLVRAHRQAAESGGRLCLAAPSRFILTVLHTMRLDGLFPVFDSREEALRRMRSGFETGV